VTQPDNLPHRLRVAASNKALSIGEAWSLLDEAADALEGVAKPTDAEADRVLAWARSRPRKPAMLAFTAGPERQAAYWIEWAWANPPPRVRVMDDQGRPVCHRCGKATNPHYARHEVLNCWNCGASFDPPQITEAAG
jgi:hypothetical protein